jgi:hypothetical protein
LRDHDSQDSDRNYNRRVRASPRSCGAPRSHCSTISDSIRVVAKVFPEYREPEYDSERRVLARLRELDDAWLVFHNIKWQALRRGRQGDGETDSRCFILVTVFS